MNRPELVTSVKAMREIVRRARKEGTIGLVPTMGALHEGHLSLVRAAKAMCETVIVSIFVNPTQFGPAEDYAQYPRTLEEDVRRLEQEEVATIFAPTVEEMYPGNGLGTFVEVPEIGDRLDGRFRPGHFRGVTTVVTKLFHIACPDISFFGQKDAAQVAVLRAMARDLNLPTRLVICPTVREPAGLALSSRNRYLSAEQRSQALVLHRSLEAAQSGYANGISDAAELRRILLGTLESEPAARIDYAEIVNPDTLLPVRDVSRGALLAVAAWIGKTRLIDNVVLPAKERSCG